MPQRILIDYPGHTRYYPWVTGVEVLETDERHAPVRYTVRIRLFSFGFHMDKYPDANRRRIEWQLAQGRAPKRRAARAAPKNQTLALRCFLVTRGLEKRRE